MSAPWIITPPRPTDEKPQEASVPEPKPKATTPKKPRKKTLKTTTNSSEK